MSKKINFNEFLIFDGGMGTMLQAHGMKGGELPESYNITSPEVIAKIHKVYLDAGAQVLTTNTFGANCYKLSGTDFSLSQVIHSAVTIAKSVAGENLVALDIGPLGQLMEPYGTLSFQDAYDAFKEQVIIGAKAGADLILIETMADIYEAKAAILAAKENSDLPVICTMTFQDNGRTLTGTDPLTMVNVLQNLGLSALGVNCSLGPKEMMPVISEILKYATIPVMVQPNAGLPKLIDDQTVFDIHPEEFATYALEMARQGVAILGGCCGTTPEHISTLKKYFKDLKDLRPLKPQGEPLTAASSSSRTEILGGEVKIIGERINPTGKKLLKAALIKEDMDYIITEAITQKDKGAHILDVNVGLPEIDEKALMVQAIMEIQGIVNLPLQIDSVTPDVIEAGARIYNGRPIINSVNGDDETMDAIFPIAKKYGCLVIGLTLDSKGIPKTAEERLAIAQRIIAKAQTYGIGKESIIIDCLVLTASAQQREVVQTIKAVQLVKEKLGVMTTLGVSNISFGLPARNILNRTFLAAALTAGLDAPILNPMEEDMTSTIKAFNVLWNHDKDSKTYVQTYSGIVPPPISSTNTSNSDLKKIIIDGLKEEGAVVVKELLKNQSGLEIVNQYLIPALDMVGEKYEAGEIFLPQLIQSAEAVKKAFEVIKKDMVLNNRNEATIEKGKVILATVKGDIHDIGKNIVKVLLENYGYQVYDLGKDVSIQKVLDTVEKEGIILVGLSALMTTTVKNMELTIQALNKHHPNCKIMVGGAVLTQEYADMIGADFYAKDARESVSIAGDVLG